MITEENLYSRIWGIFNFMKVKVDKCNILQILNRNFRD